jgi:hypothetical protein
MNVIRGHIIIVFACYALSGHGLAVDVLTYHNDNAHTGLNSQEVTLTPRNVNANSFGLIRNLPVDGAVFAQTLYASNAQVISAGQSQGFHNLLIVATEHDSVYAFDADSGMPYWQISMLGAGEVPVRRARLRRSTRRKWYHLHPGDRSHYGTARYHLRPRNEQNAKQYKLL